MIVKTLFHSIYQIYSKSEKNSEVLEAFKMFDTDEDGKVSINDIIKLLRELSYCGQIEDSNLKAVLNWASKNMPENVSLENFEKLWRYLTKNDQDTRKAFNTLDINRDGYVSKAELVFYLKSLDMVLEKDDEDSTVLNCFYRLDLNGDGKISYPEFVMGWKFYS